VCGRHGALPPPTGGPGAPRADLRGIARAMTGPFGPFVGRFVGLAGRSRRNRRPNFTLLWAAGAFAAVCWLLEPLISEAVTGGSFLAGVLVLPDPTDLWVRASIVLLFVLMGMYEQAMLGRLERSERKYHDLVERIPDVTWTADAAGGRVFVSPNASQVLGYAPRELYTGAADLWWNITHPDDSGEVRSAYATLFGDGTPFDLEYRVRHKTGAWVWMHDRAMATYERGGRRFADGVMTDVTARKEAQEQLHYVSYFDPLTGLPNRTLLRDRLGQALAQARRHEHHVAVLLLEISGFREINDTHGAATGDPALCDAVERLKTALREEDTIARWGGDDLAVVLPEVPDPAYAAHVAQKLINLLDTVIVVDDAELPLGACVGVSLAPEHGTDPDTLLRNAATAMVQSRRMGRNAYHIYTKDLHTRAAHRLKLEAALRRALEQGEIQTYYQPQVDLASGRVVGMEALARWQSPELGLVMPGEFIPLAEETGLVVPIGLQVLELACRQLRRWEQDGLPPVRVSANLSGRHFWEHDLSASVRQVLEATGLDPRYLELEITESTMMQNVDQTIRTLDNLKAMDLHLAIDDFGTGHASLSYLKRFPLDTLKIDRSFVIDCPRDADDAALTRAIIAMAHSLRLSVVAEGVETVEQLAFLKAHRCDTVQGYLFARPLPADQMAKILASGGILQVPGVRRRIAVPLT
jgi:diguanylate cyclase (GGDEF)-like protein/PAS domain S-box-containing protein